MTSALKVQTEKQIKLIQESDSYLSFENKIPIKNEVTQMRVSKITQLNLQRSI